MGDMVMGKCKGRQKIISIFKQTINISEDMEDYNFAMFTHAMDFFQRTCEF
jgi:hypothetical protein